MSKQSSKSLQGVVRSVGAIEPAEMDWGRLVWLVGARQTPGAEQTLGVVTIHPGKRNPLHRHPNCEELLYMLEGTANHRLGDAMFHLKAGDVIRIPRGVPHLAEATGDTPLVAVISFSSADRLTKTLEDDDDLA